MKRWLLTLLTVCLIVGLTVPAYATESGDDPDNMTGQQEEIQPQEPTQEKQQPGEQQEPQNSPVVVSTFEELQAAVDAAKDGDIIAISDSIYIFNAVLTTDKSITLTRVDNFNKVLLYLKDGGGIEGFTFEETADADITIDIFDSENSFINNCTFKGIIEHNTRFVEIYCVYSKKTNVSIENCSFYGNGKGAMSIKSNAEVEIHDCTFNNNFTWLQGGAIYNDGGSLIIDNCIIANNNAASGGGIFNSGDLTITNSQIYANTITNSKFGSDILSLGTLSIDNYTLENMAVYDESTGEKLALPLVDHVDIAKLVYLTEEQAAEYFTPEPSKDEEPIPPEPGDDGSGENIPPEQPQPPQEPGNQAGDNDTADEEQPPQEPPQPPDGEGKDDPITPPEAPEQPIEPPQSDTKDDPIDTPIPTPDTPQQPTDSGDSENDDHTPPVSHRPTYRPSTPVATPIKPTPTPEPEEKPKLSCGGAVIDTSRTVVLLGYGDGDPHEKDSLTRAQLATIIYRLLDESSIVQLSNSEAAFADVPPEMWCYKYVQIIQKAGIVYGAGGGCYSPNGLVTWAQVVTVLSRFTEPQEYTLQHIEYDGWAVEAVQTAVALGWIQDRADLSPDAVISRGELVQLVNGVLELNR